MNQSQTFRFRGKTRSSRDCLTQVLGFTDEAITDAINTGVFTNGLKHGPDLSRRCDADGSVCVHDEDPSYADNEGIEGSFQQGIPTLAGDVCA